MDSLILSSKYGRRRIVTAKLIAGLIFTFGWVTAFYGVCVMVCFTPYGFVGWDAPLNSSYIFRESLYPLTMLQGLFLQYVLALIGACGLLIWTALISAAFRSSLTSFGLAVTLVILPFISFPGIVGKIVNFLPSSIMASSHLIESYKTYNLFNTPILYLTVFIVVTVILGILITLLIPKTFERRLKV
ncbi:ABC-2 family transporter protein [compost metagenome]